MESNNEDEMQIDYKMLNEAVNNYKVLNENSFNYEVSNEELLVDKVSNDKENDYEVLNGNFFGYEILIDDEVSSEDEMLDDKETDKIIDEALSNKQMPSINREFMPYFKNVTETLLF